MAKLMTPVSSAFAGIPMQKIALRNWASVITFRQSAARRRIVARSPPMACPLPAIRGSIVSVYSAATNPTPPATMNTPCG